MIQMLYYSSIMLNKFFHSNCEYYEILYYMCLFLKPRTWLRHLFNVAKCE